VLTVLDAGLPVRFEDKVERERANSQHWIVSDHTYSFDGAVRLSDIIKRLSNNKFCTEFKLNGTDLSF